MSKRINLILKLIYTGVRRASARECITSLDRCCLSPPVKVKQTFIITIITKYRVLVKS